MTRTIIALLTALLVAAGFTLHMLAGVDRNGEGVVGGFGHNRKFIRWRFLAARALLLAVTSGYCRGMSSESLALPKKEAKSMNRQVAPPPVDPSRQDNWLDLFEMVGFLLAGCWSIVILVGILFLMAFSYQ